MDKPNVFRTSEFYMSEGDTLHVSIKYEAGSDTVDLDLVAGDSGVVGASTVPVFSAWSLPNSAECVAIIANVTNAGKGNFLEEAYWTSSQNGPVSAGLAGLYDGSIGHGNKSDSYYVRPIRSFVFMPDQYSLGDTGPSGGWIFYVDNGVYYEVGPSDIGSPIPWSNIVNGSVGTQPFGIGDGFECTSIIIAQEGHLSSAASVCRAYSV